MAVEILVKTKDGRSALGKGHSSITVSSTNVSIKEVKALIAAIRKLHPTRQRLTLPAPPGARGTVLDDKTLLSDYEINSGDAIVLKDLGPQIGYQAVFFWEYFGPLVVYPLFYFFPSLIYGRSAEHAFAQKAALLFWSVHYIKRIAETFLVHKFGHATMPLRNLVKNCSYYWSFAGFISYFVNHPLYTAPPTTQTIVALTAAFACTFSNLKCHLILANLRASGSTGYSIPRGFLFNYITCANYTVEIWSWIFFSIATQSLPALVFAIAGAAQMAIWAGGKHRRLKKIFDGKEGRERYPKRYIMFPPFY